MDKLNIYTITYFAYDGHDSIDTVVRFSIEEAIASANDYLSSCVPANFKIQTWKDGIHFGDNDDFKRFYDDSIIVGIKLHECKTSEPGFELVK